MESKIILCTDDICPRFIKRYWTTWSLLRSNHDNLKLNAFVVPHYMDDDNDFILSDYFKDWYSSCKDWVSLHLHGYAHTYPPECTFPYEEQYELIERGTKILEEICGHRNFGFKAPGYHANEVTERIAIELGLKFICYSDHIEFLIATNVTPNNYMLIQTHSDGRSMDSIERIYERLNSFIRGKKFVHIMELLEK